MSTVIMFYRAVVTIRYGDVSKKVVLSEIISSTVNKSSPKDWEVLRKSLVNSIISRVKQEEGLDDDEFILEEDVDITQFNVLHKGK